MAGVWLARNCNLSANLRKRSFGDVFQHADYLRYISLELHRGDKKVCLKAENRSRVTQIIRGVVSMSIRVAIAGVGNCASSLVQGVEYY